MEILADFGFHSNEGQNKRTIFSFLSSFRIRNRKIHKYHGWRAKLAQSPELRVTKSGFECILHVIGDIYKIFDFIFEISPKFCRVSICFNHTWWTFSKSDQISMSDNFKVRHRKSDLRTPSFSAKNLGLQDIRLCNSLSSEWLSAKRNT